jgi:signal transduction histidine kinase/CheY-like chemotaxis protein
MKRLYIIFYIAGVIAVVLLTRSTVWLVAGISGCMAFLLYRIYASRLLTVCLRASALEQQIESLHDQLDASIRKEQRLSRAAEQATAVKKRVMAAMSHEIRTPMNGVMGMATLLSETRLDGQQREYINGIQHCSHQLIAVVNHILVDDMLNISKAGEDKTPLMNEDFDLRSCIEEVLDMFGAAIGTTGPELLYRIDDDIPAQLSGDAGRLRQILINLLENAVRVTSHGEIFVGVRLLKKDDTRLELGFEVRDTGVGIPADKIGRIFEGSSGSLDGSPAAGTTTATPTAANPGATTPDTDEPSGLGLVICRRLVETMDGWIEVQSEPGKGSTFTFCVQVSPGRKPLRNSLHPGMAALQGKRILLVDDNMLALSLLAGQLQQWKAIPVVAGSGKQALKELSSDDGFDLIIADAGLPNTSELTDSMQEQSPNTPVILMTRPGAIGKEAAGVTAQLTKPVKQHLLRDQLVHLFFSSDGSDTTNGNPNGGDKNTGAPADRLNADFATRHPLRILVAEDNPMNQKIVMKMLTRLGYQPDIAANGKEVLEEVSNQRYDLVFMDVQMPELDGLEATRMIRLCLEVQPVIIAMTANAMQGDRDSCLQAGMDDYISKPIDLDDLLGQLEKWSAVINGSRRQ